jgi:diacylglycerol kinase family enzyme
MPQEPTPRKVAPSVAKAPRIAVVANPIKPHALELVIQLRHRCELEGWPPPMVFTTTVDDPGAGQARQALADGATLVIVAGGDGTVRIAADALAGSSAAMAIVPLGTGNLLARNLTLPIGSLDDAIDVALGGNQMPVDLGRARIRRADGTVTIHPFCVIAGLGFDAEMVGDTSSALKKKIGWLAYFAAGIRHLHEPRIHVRKAVDRGPGAETRARSVLVGNCGRLPGGLKLLPHARVNDGLLDIATIDIRGGLAGWLQLAVAVIRQGTRHGRRPGGILGRIEHEQATHVSLAVTSPVEAQVDGDHLGLVTRMDTWIEPGGLQVKVV